MNLESSNDAPEAVTVSTEVTEPPDGNVNGIHDASATELSEIESELDEDKSLVEPEESITDAGEVPTDPEEVRLRRALNEAEEARQRALTQVAGLRRQQARLQGRQTRTSRSLDQINGETDDFQEAQKGLRTWVSSRSRSFAWRLLKELKGHSESLDAEYSQLKEVVDQPIAVAGETPSALQDAFMKRVLLTIGITFSLFIIVTVLKGNFPQLQSWQSWLNPFAWPTWLLAVVMLGIMIAVWALLLISYYRANSQRRHRLSVAQQYVNFLASTTEDMRVERQRLNTLHAQVPEYLKYLSEVLHRPWVPPVIRTGIASPRTSAKESLAVTAEEIVFDSSRPDADFLPAFMRLAEVPELTGGDKEQALVRDAIQFVLAPGWRYSALARLLAEVEKALSLPADSLAPARLDRDPRLRETVIEALQSTAAHSEAGREMLKSLARQIQVSVMDTIHPPVKNIAPDPLAELDLDTDFIDGTNRSLVEWDDFLSENLGDPGAWSPAAFSPEGRQAIPTVKSEAYGAQRLGPRVDTDVTFHPIAERTARPIELSIRVDRTQNPLAPSLFAVFDGYVEQSDPAEGLLSGSSSTAEHENSDEELDHL